MSKFKKGDKVIRVNKGFSDMKVGDKGTVVKYISTGVYLEEFVGGHDPDNLKLIEENKMKFDMKKEPWFIRYNNEEEFNLVQEWLDKNYGEPMDCHYVSYSKYITNAAESGYLFETPKYGRNEKIESYAKEIKLTFKTIVDSVEWPEVESEAQKKIKELEQTINSAKVQIEQLEQTIQEASQQIAELKKTV
jgi:hypothetical protein